ncbi:hypothetical protein BHYA_0196g00170 [Botrytis hyacinthi]|uniref:Uncharacterized protein n=1 Tax=Botrytis hyacinthi TaxID=278943 RepID=A0A4Z1GJ25_9HELO|nr:hypothetical protein BHYA_0196g00170 [Botrytis hyacinthi]
MVLCILTPRSTVNMEGLSPGAFGYIPAPSMWHKDPDISNDLSLSYVGNQMVHADGIKMAMINVDSAVYTSKRKICLPNDDLQSVCIDCMPDWSARRDTAL